MSSPVPVAPAGWYPDPEDVTQQRYWDGGRWTDHRAPATPQEVVGGQSFYNASADAARGRNTFARNALVLGIISIAICWAVPLTYGLSILPAMAAIVWGILGNVRASRSGIGRAAAVWGLVLGGVAFTIGIGIVL